MKFSEETREAIRTIFDGTDAAIAVSADVFHPGTLRALFAEFAEQTARFDPELAETLVPVRTNAALGVPPRQT